MPSLDRQYKFRVDFEGAQYWIDPITIIPHEVNEIDMDLDLLGLDLTGDRLYAHNRSKGEKIQLAMVGLPYGLLLNSVIAAPSVNESIYYYHNDHLGTPQVLTDDQSQIVWKADYKPFGEVDIVVETVENNLRFPGQYYDGETGLHYNYFRNYHAGIGRYLTPDPLYSYADPLMEDYAVDPASIPAVGGLFLYTYADNSPIRFFDKLGLLITTIGCQNGEKIVTAVHSARRKVESGCIGNKKLEKCVKGKLGNLKIICYNNPNGWCGWAKPWGKTIHINEGRACGPTPGTILHETVHTCHGSEKKAYGCEERCFPGSSGGRGNPCDCQ